ncbi:MAG: hypothetical protein WCX61_01470 [Candidatus Peribacteraceae bacterium]
MDHRAFCTRKGQVCAYSSKEGCYNSLIQGSGGLELVLLNQRCTHAKVEKSFGTMTPAGFLPDDKDPTGNGRILDVFLRKLGIYP